MKSDIEIIESLEYPENEITLKAIEAIKTRHKFVGNIKTPSKYIKSKGGIDYVPCAYMKSVANRYYAGWKWTIVKFNIFTYNERPEAAITQGRLLWFENGMWRHGDMVASHRIQFKSEVVVDDKGRGTKDTDNKWIKKSGNTIVDIGNDIKSSNTDCMKKAFNMYMNIADDVYRYHIEDISLSKKERDTLLTLAKKVGLKDKILIQIEMEMITKNSYDKAIKRLESLQ